MSRTAEVSNPSTGVVDLGARAPPKRTPMDKPKLTDRSSVRASRSVVVLQGRPQGRPPGGGDPAQGDHAALLLVVDTDTVVHDGHPPAVAEVRGQLGEVLGPGEHEVAVLGWRPFEVQLVLAAVGRG